MSILNRWNSDIVSPFKFINENCYLSGRCKDFHNENTSLFSKPKGKRLLKFGTQTKEELVNLHSYDFNYESVVNNVF